MPGFLGRWVLFRRRCEKMRQPNPTHFYYVPDRDRSVDWIDSPSAERETVDR